MKTRRRFPSGFFVSDLERHMISVDNPGAGWFAPDVHVSRDKLMTAINQVELLADWLEDRMIETRFPHRRCPEYSNPRAREGFVMPHACEWSKLNHLQSGRYAEYFVKIQFVLLGYEVYSSEVDDRGIAFVLRRDPGLYWDVQVKSIRKTGYVFVTKDKFSIRPNLLMALVVFNDAQEPDLYLIPAMAWLHPNGVPVDRDSYSKPEYGINLSLRGIAPLAQYRLGAIADQALPCEGAPPGGITPPTSPSEIG
jgi:hypothetical protein